MSDYLSVCLSHLFNKQQSMLSVHYNVSVTIKSSTNYMKEYIRLKKNHYKIKKSMISKYLIFDVDNFIKSSADIAHFILRAKDL